MDIRKIIYKILSEADVKVQNLPSIKNREGGSSAALARAQFLQGKVEKNLSSLGVYGIQGYMEEQGIFSLDRIKEVGRFHFSFKTQKGKDFDGEAEFSKTYSQLFNTLVLEFYGSGVQLLIAFDRESLNRTFMSKNISDKKFGGSNKKRTIQGLQEDETFPVTIMNGKNIGGLTGDNIKDVKRKETKIKILDIGIQKSTKEKYTIFSKKDWVQVKGAIDITSGDIKSLENLQNKVTADKIEKMLTSGVFYVRLSEKESQTIILSDRPGDGGIFLVIESDESINEAEPQEWTNVSVTIGQNAIANYRWPDVKGFIKFLRPIKK